MAQPSWPSTRGKAPRATELTMPERECEIIHEAATGGPCCRPAATVARLHEGREYFCAELGREWGGPIDPAAAVRAEAE